VAFPQSARTNFEYGFQLQKAGLTEESVPYLKKSMELDPAYEEPFFFYGRILIQDEQYAEAAAYLRTALKIRPDYVAACVALARALLETDKTEETVTELKKCAGLSPTHPQPHLLLSQAYFRMGDEVRARAEKDLSLRLRRAHPEIMEAPQARPFPRQ
jgi:predicted Zn-dependent protease